MDIENKVVVITGSSSGIGKETALAFAAEGANVIVNSRINVDGGKAVVEEIKKKGGNAIYVQADVSNPDDIKKLFDETIRKYRTIDILINNAAYPSEKVPFFEASKQDLLDLMDINVIAMMLCSQYAIKFMKKQGYGKIINTSSIKGWEHGGGSITYAVSKAAVNSFTRTLAKQVAPTIQVNAVAPGYTKTRIYDGIPDEKIQEWIDGTYLKRWVTVEEIARTFIFIAENDAMTGQVIYVDAGFTLK